MAKKTDTSYLSRIQSVLKHTGANVYKYDADEEDEEERLAQAQQDAANRSAQAAYLSYADQLANNGYQTSQDRALTQSEQIARANMEQSKAKRLYASYLNELDSAQRNAYSNSNDLAKTNEELMARSGVTQAKLQKDAIESKAADGMDVEGAKTRLGNLDKDVADQIYKAVSDMNSSNPLKSIGSMGRAEKKFEQIKADTGMDDDTLNQYISDAKTLTDYDWNVKNALSSDEQLSYYKDQLSSLKGNDLKLMNQYMQSKKIENESENAEMAKINGGDSYVSTKELKKQIKDAGLSKYIDSANTLADYESTQEANKNYDINGNKALGVIRNFGAGVLGDVTGGIPATIEDKLHIGNQYDTAHRLSNVSQYANAQSQEALEDTNWLGTKANNFSKNITGQNIAQNLYSGLESTAVSGIDVAIGAGAGQLAAGLGASEKVAKGVSAATGYIPFFASAYDSKYNDARSRGVNDSQARALANIAGAAEVITEIASFDNLLKLANGDKEVKNLLLGALSQMPFEMSEEVSSDLINDVADFAITAKDGRSSKFNQLMNEAMQNGATEDEAKSSATKQMVQEIVADGLGGAFSGGIMGGVASGAGAVNSHQLNNRVKDIQSNYADMAANTTDETAKAKYEAYAANPYEKIAQDIDRSNKYGQEAGEKADQYSKQFKETGKVSISDRADLKQSLDVASSASEYYGQRENAIQDIQNKSTPEEYRVQRTDITSNEGYTKVMDAIKKNDTQAISDAVQEMKHSTNAEARRMADSILEDLTPYAESKGIDMSTVEKTSTQEAYTAGLNGEELTTSNSKVQEAYNAGKQKAYEMKTKTMVESADSLKNVHAKTVIGEDVTLSHFKDGQIIDTNGNAHDINDLNVEDTGYGNAFLNANTLRTDAEKNSYLSNIKDGTILSQYNKEFKKYYVAGKSDLEFDKVAEGGFNYIDEETARNIFDEGTKEQYNKLTQAAAKVLQKTFKVTQGSGTFTDNRKGFKMDSASLVGKVLANVTGLDIVIEGNAKTANGQTINAEFNPTTSTITVHGEEAMKQLFHEVGEFVEFYNAEGHESLRQGLNETALSIFGGEAYDRWQNDYMKAYTKAGDAQTNRQITNEMTNDLLVAVMESAEGRKAMAKYLAEHTDQSTAEAIGYKISNMFSSISDAIKDIVQNSNKSFQGQALRRDQYKQLSKYADQFVNELDKAIQKYQSGEVKTYTAEKIEEFSVKIGMTDNQRYRALVHEQIAIPSMNEALIPNTESEYEKLRAKKIKEAKKAAIALADALKLRNTYKTKDLKFEFEYSGNGISESSDKQIDIKIHDRLVKFGQMLTCLPKVINEARLIDTYTDQEYNAIHPEHPINNHLKMSYVLASAFDDGEKINPVKITVLEYDDTMAKIHLAIVMPSIEKTRLSEVATHNNKPHISNLVVKYKLSSLLREVKNNPMSDSLGQYIPDKFLDTITKKSVNVEDTEISQAVESVGFDYDVETESFNPSSFSVNTWNESDYVKDKSKAAKAIAKAIGVSVKEATKYIDDINSIAKIIADDRVRLDYDANPYSSSFVSNSEYGGSIDFSTICKKRLLYTGTLQEIQKQVGNRVITVDDYLAIRNAMLEDGLQATCGCCYVEGSRAKLGQFMEQFIKRYAENHDGYIPNMYDVTMPDGIRQLRAQHPDVYEAREYFLNHMGQVEGNEGEKNLFGSQGKPKDYTERTEYRGEILDRFLGKEDTVKEKNLNGGLRLQSFSDFEIVNLIDCMQVITDMSRCGLAGQAYTKVFEFADALGNTGLKINLSLMGAGVDENGHLILDEVNGMKKSDAITLRNKYSKNVGTIIVCFTDEQIKAAMKEDYIDFIIPFHRSQWRKSQYEALGLPQGTRDYTMHQNDRIIKDNGRLKKADRNYMPNEYWDYSKTGRENAEKYIDMCNKDGKAPKFAFLLDKVDGKYVLPEGSDYDGYFKLLIDFKMYDNDGVGSPQMPVKPIFSMDECKQMLNDYTGGHDTFPVAKEIADRFAEKIKARGKEFTVSSTGAERYSLEVVDPVVPTTDKWEYGTTYDEAKAMQPTLFDTEGMTEEKANGTQITSTVKTYRNIFDMLKNEGFKGRILDASSGKGLGTKAGREDYGFDIDDIEPYAGDDYDPKYTDYSQLFNTYDVIISNAVLNVTTQDQRDSLVKKMGEMLKPGGRMFINVRGKDVLNSKGKIPFNEKLMEYFIPGSRSYQKGFTVPELKAYLQDALGSDFTIGSKFATTGVIVTKALDAEMDPRYSKYSINVDSDGTELTEGQKEYFKDSKVVDEDGRLMVMYHGTDAYEEFNVFKKGKSGYLGGGIYLTNSESYANRYAKQNGYEGRIYKTYVNITNPLVVTSDTPANEILGEKVAQRRAQKNSYSTQWITSADIKKLQDKGYDGIIWKYGSAPIEVSVWNSNQIKNVDNENPTSDADIRYSINVDSDGTELTEGQKEYFKDSKVVDKYGNLKVMYHGTGEEFTVFDPLKLGGKNGKNEGYGLYFADTTEISKSYGTRILKGYLNITHPASKLEQNISSSDLQKLIKSVCIDEANKMVANGDYDNVSDALKDTWISNYVYTYDKSIEQAYREVAKSIMNMSDNDFDIVQEVMSGIGVRDYESAYNFYDILTDTLGIDGFITEWENQDTGEKNQIALALRSNQFKNIDNENPTSSDDIRYSIKVDTTLDDIFGEDTTDAKATTETSSILKRGVECLKNIQVSEKAINKLAKQIKSDTGSNIKTATLADDLNKIFSYMQNEDFVDYDEMTNVIQDLATSVIDQATEKVGVEAYKTFTNALKGYSLRLTDEQMSEVKRVYGNFAEFKKQVAPLNISTKGAVTLEQAWSEMVPASGYALDMDTVEGDMPFVLADTLASLKPTIANIYGMDAEQTAKDLAMKIVQGYFEAASSELKDTTNSKDEQIKQLKKEMRYREKWAAAENNLMYEWTEAERKQALKDLSNEMHQKNDEYVKQIRKDYNQRLNEVRDKRDQTIADIKAKNRQRAKDAKNRRETREIKEQVSKNANALMTMAIKPTDNKHIPKVMMEPVMSFLEALNFVEPVVTQEKDGMWTAKIYDRSSGHGVFRTIEATSREKCLEKYYKAMQTGMGTQSQLRWQDKMKGIQEIYDAVMEGKELDNQYTELADMREILDDDLAAELKDFLEANKDADDIKINQLDKNELRLINNVLKNIQTAIRNQDKLLASEGDVSQSAIDLRNYSDTLKDRKISPDKINQLSNMLRVDMLNPYVAFHFLGETGKKLYRGLRNGMNTRTNDIKSAGDYMKQKVEELGITSKDFKKWSGKNPDDIKEFRVAEGLVRVSDNQIMSLYETMKQHGMFDEAGGGFTFSAIQGNGKYNTRPSTPVHLTEADILSMTSTLDAKAKALADAMQQYMANVSSKDGNEVSERLFGYDKYVNKDYFPTKRDQRYIDTKDSNVSDKALSVNPGFTHSRVHNSKPLMISDIFDVFTKHVDEMANYHGNKIACKDITRVLNYRADSFNSKDSINKLLFSDSVNNAGVNYVTNLLTDIDGQHKQNGNGSAKLIDTLMGNFKAASVMGNVRVVLQQPTAYLRALDMVDAKYLFNAKNLRALKHLDEIAELNPSVWWKSQGYFDTNIGQSMKSLVTDQQSFKDVINEKAGALAGKADDMTWGILYYAVEAEQRDQWKGKGLTEEQFREKVNQRFDDVVDETQVIDSTLHRSQYMRSNRDFHKMQTAFMAEPTKSYNMMMLHAVDDIRTEGHVGKGSARAITAWALASIATSAAAAVWDAVRYDDDDDKWYEVYLENLKSNLVDNLNPLNMIPWVKDVFSAGVVPAIKTIKGESNTYGSSSSRYDLDSVTDALQAAATVYKYFDGTGTKNGYGTIMAVAKPLSQVFGIPLYSVARDLTATWNIIGNQIGAGITTTKQTTSEKKTDFLDAVEKGYSDELIERQVDEAEEFDGLSIKDLRSSVQSKFKNDYMDAVQTYGIDSDEANAIADEAAKAYSYLMMSDEEADETINGWLDESLSYTDLDKAIKNNDPEAAVNETLILIDPDNPGRKDSDKVTEHIMNTFGADVDREDARETDTKYRESVESALKTIDGTYTYESVKEDLAEKEAESEAKKEKDDANKALKNDLYDAIDNGGDYQKSVDAMIESNMEAKTIKSGLTTHYKDTYMEAVSNNDLKTAGNIKQSVAKAKAYVDRKYKVDIPAKWDGDYYAYEVDQINTGWVEEK